MKHGPVLESLGISPFTKYFANDQLSGGGVDWVGNDTSLTPEEIYEHKVNFKIE